MWGSEFCRNPKKGGPRARKKVRALFIASLAGAKWANIDEAAGPSPDLAGIVVAVGLSPFSPGVRSAAAPSARHLHSPSDSSFSSERTQAFLLVGTLPLLPVILMYTGRSYWVIRGKVRADIGYHTIVVRCTAGSCQTPTRRQRRQLRANAH